MNLPPYATLLFVLSTTAAEAAYKDDAIFRQPFEDPDIDTWDFGGDLLDVQELLRGGSDHGHILEVAYPPNDIGSVRILQKFDLDEDVTSATLSYDIKLHHEFEFVRGGKLHGLGGGSVTTGCGPIDRKGWTVRLIWKEEGVPALYVYHQDREANCGDQFTANDFKFTRDRWYRIDLQVEMNSNKNAHDGKAVLYIDGEKQVEVNDLRLSGKSSVDIDKFLFSTFYGGGAKDWSPSKTTYVYFDNFTVLRGLRVTGHEGGECEMFLNGIYSPSDEICCAESCGFCGDSDDCGNLPGGDTKCCTGLIGRSDVRCDASSGAPCKYEEEPSSQPSSLPSSIPSAVAVEEEVIEEPRPDHPIDQQQLQQCSTLLQFANFDFTNLSNYDEILDSGEYVTFLNNLAKVLHPHGVQWIRFDIYSDLPEELIANFIHLSCMCPLMENCCADSIGIYIGHGIDGSGLLYGICKQTLMKLNDLRWETLSGLLSFKHALSNEKSLETLHSKPSESSGAIFWSAGNNFGALPFPRYLWVYLVALHALLTAAVGL